MKNKILSRWFGGEHPASQHTTQPGLRPGLSVLVVDDSRTQLFGIEKLLKAEGVKTYTAENGKQGILMARHVKPDLILMDIVMPEINGFQATRYLTRQPDTGHIPIIIISGTDQQSDRLWGLKLGAKDYMQKPVKRELLLAKIAYWTSQQAQIKPVVRNGKEASTDSAPLLGEAI